MSVITLDHYQNGAKIMRPVLKRDEYLALRSSNKQLAMLKAVRSGDEAKKRRLLQMNYSCLPGDDGVLKGCTRMSTTVGMDIDHVPREQMQPLCERILAKKDVIDLLMLERSARGAGYHLVFKRRPELSQQQNLEWASQVLEVPYDAGAKDITRVFYSTSAAPEDLIYLDDAIFEIEEVTILPPKFLAEPSGKAERGGNQRGLNKGIGEGNSALAQTTPNPSYSGGEMDSKLWDWGEEIEKLSDDFPILRDICKGLKRNQYPAAMFVGGGLLMTLMTRCTYRFYHRPEELRRLNNSTLIIGDPASGKSFATRLFKLLAAPIVAADKAGKDAINAYREQMRTKGANKEKPKKPKVIVRIHPARTSNAQFIQDMVNSVEEVDGQPMQLHMLTFDTELDNTVSVQKGGSWIDKFSMELKAFHNEEDGQAYSNNDSILQDFIVTWNFIYTGTPIALKKKVNEQNFGSGLATRLTCIPLPATNFQMLSRESTLDYDSDNRLKEWALKLDKTKGELPLQKIVDELYDWTARRMMDAADNDSRADEMLLKRCAYHGLNFAAPFIVMRHWSELHQDGDYWCGQFETDEVDWRLAELIVNIQYACQRHYFGAMAEAYFDNKLREASVNVQRRSKTYDGFERLPDEFTCDDVMRCFNLNTTSAARMRISRLTRDRLIEKTGDFNDNGKSKSSYRKTGVVMM